MGGVGAGRGGGLEGDGILPRMHSGIPLGFRGIYTTPPTPPCSYPLLKKRPNWLVEWLSVTSLA